MWARRTWKGVRTTLSGLIRLPGVLNWLLSVVEPLIVLGIGFLAFYTAYWIVFGPEGSERQARLLGLVQQASKNWKAAVLLLVLLFYRTVRTFVEQMEEGPFGTKRPLKGQTLERENPLKAQTVEAENPEREKNP